MGAIFTVGKASCLMAEMASKAISGKFSVFRTLLKCKCLNAETKMYIYNLVFLIPLPPRAATSLDLLEMKRLPLRSLFLLKAEVEAGNTSISPRRLGEVQHRPSIDTLISAFKGIRNSF